jgi:hypothetical protein
MNNYPPGVTGAEYEIAGGIETEEYWQCESTVKAITISMPTILDMSEDIFTVFTQLRDHNYISYRALVDQKVRNIKRKLEDLTHSDDAIEVDCGFYGTVLMESYKNKKWWSCPNCRKEHEIETDYYRD